MLGASPCRARSIPGLLALALCALPLTVVAKEVDEVPLEGRHVSSSWSHTASDARTVVIAYDETTGAAAQQLVFVNDKGQHLSLENPEHAARVDRLAARYGSPFLWFLREGDEYVVVDTARLAPLEKAFAESPEDALATARGAEVGAALASIEARVARAHATLVVEQAKLASRREGLAAERARNGSGLQRSGLDGKLAALDKETAGLSQRIADEIAQIELEKEPLRREKEAAFSLPGKRLERRKRALVELVDRAIAEKWAVRVQLGAREASAR